MAEILEMSDTMRKTKTNIGINLYLLRKKEITIEIKILEVIVVPDIKKKVEEILEIIQDQINAPDRDLGIVKLEKILIEKKYMLKKQ
jgi:hypothetical protein